MQVRGRKSIQRILGIIGFILLVSFFPSFAAYGQEPCSGNSHWDIPGKVLDKVTYTVGARDDWRALPSEIAALVPEANALLGPILKLDYVSHPKGLQIAYYRALGTPDPGNMTLESQPFPLKVEAMIFGFHCLNGKVYRRWGDADAGLTIEMNSLFEILDNTTMKLNGKKVYLLHLDLGEYRGYKLLAPYTNNPVDDSRYERALLIPKAGRLPFTYITRKEVLDHLRGELKKGAKTEPDRAASTITIRPKEVQEAEKLRRVEEIKGYNISEQAKRARIDRYLADYRTDEQKRDQAVVQTNLQFEKRRQRLEALYQKWGAAGLEEPAAVKAGTAPHLSILDTDDSIFVSPKIDLTQNCYPRCQFGQYLVMLNEEYYDKRLPRTGPQLYVVSVGSLGRRAELNPYQLRIRDRSLADIDLDELASRLPK